jgi:hypothetical protein
MAASCPFPHTISVLHNAILSIENASRKLQVVQQILQNEVNIFQNRLQRCSADCEDSVRDRYPNLQTSENDFNKAQREMYQCANICADKHIAMLKGIQIKIESDLDKI